MAWLLPARYTMGVSRNKRWLYTAIVTSYASAPSMAVSRDPSSTYKSSVAWSRDLIQLDREAFTLYTCHVTMAWLIPARYTMGVSRDKRWLYTVIVTSNAAAPPSMAVSRDPSSTYRSTVAWSRDLNPNTARQGGSGHSLQSRWQYNGSTAAVQRQYNRHVLCRFNK